jgi:isoquinoline 1-oxidoreductase beta subunit
MVLPVGLPDGRIDPDAVEGAQEAPYDFPVVHGDWTALIPDSLHLVAWRRLDV